MPPVPHGNIIHLKVITKRLWQF